MSTASDQFPSAGQSLLFEVLRGDPTDEELAALTAVVLSLSPTQPAPALRRHSRSWLRRQELQLRPAPGPGAWRRSRG